MLFEELLAKLKQLPEIDLLEILEISSEDLVERFEDKVEGKYDQLIYEFEEDTERNNNQGA